MKRAEAELETLKMFKRINESSERIEKAIKEEKDKKDFWKVFAGIYFIICAFGTVDIVMMIVEKFI